MTVLLGWLLRLLLAGLVVFTIATATGRAFDQSFALREGEPTAAATGAPYAVASAAPHRELASPSLSVSVAGKARSLAAVSVWIRMADCESGDGDGKPPYLATWTYNGLHDGGLQFVPSTWNAAKRLSEVRRFAARYGYAYHAPAWVQIAVADNWRRHTSWAQWPTCSRKLGLR